MTSTGLVWFRNDLRVQDNGSLHKAIAENDKVVGIYFFDPRLFDKDTFGFKKTERFRAKFLLETIIALRKNLEAHHVTLLVFQQSPEDVFPQLLENLEVQRVYLQKEWTRDESLVVQRCKKNIRKRNITWIETYDQFLFHPEDIPYDMEKLPKIFTDFRKKCEKYSRVREVNSIPILSQSNIIDLYTAIPSLEELGFEKFSKDSRTVFPFEGGEENALKRVQHYFWETQKLSTYKRTRNGLIGMDYSSKFSPWLANGSISPRIIYHQIKKYEQKIKKNESSYWLIFELVWRDFFKYVSLKHGNTIFTLGGILEREYDWKDDPELVTNWIEGNTKEPFVNANMKEIKKTGWMSNRGRQNVASYFAKTLELDWRIGAAYFESMLLDYDVHSNYGNWMYVAGVGNDPRDRKFNVSLQAERYDPNSTYQKLWSQLVLL